MQPDKNNQPTSSPSGPRTDLRSLDASELEEFVTSLGQPRFRAKQIGEWIWSKNVSSFDDMTNIPKSLREQLAERFSLGGTTEVTRQLSRDGSRKYLLRFADGVAVECVGMPTKNRLAVCASTQAGCAMGCVFCSTGKSGLTRSLTAAEIYEQVMHVRDDFNTRVTSVVLMGQGEPFANYDASVGALRLLNSEDGGGIGARHLTVSTSGIIPGILRFAKEPEQFTLAVSLHSAVQRTRDALMPWANMSRRPVVARPTNSLSLPASTIPRTRSAPSVTSAEARSLTSISFSSTRFRARSFIPLQRRRSRSSSRGSRRLAWSVP